MANHWRIDEEYFHHETGMHVVKFKNRHNNATHLMQVMTKWPCPTCGNIQRLAVEGKIDIAREKQAMLDELNAIHEAELEHAKAHGIPTR